MNQVSSPLRSSKSRRGDCADRVRERERETEIILNTENWIISFQYQEVYYYDFSFFRKMLIAQINKIYCPFCDSWDFFLSCASLDATLFGI